MEAAFQDAAENMFESVGASTDLLEQWRLIEQRAFSPSKAGGGIALAPSERSAALHCLATSMKVVGLDPIRCWEAMSILDAYLLAAPGGVAVGNIPVTVVALIRILMKVDRADLKLGFEFVNCVGSYVGALAVALQGKDRVIVPISEETVRDAELSVLKALQWRINLAPAVAWVDKFCARLGGLGGAQVQQVLWHLRWKCFDDAASLAQRAASSPEFPPRTAALGLLALALLRAGLLSPGSLHPGSLSAEEWAGLLLGAGARPADAPAAPANAQKTMLQLLIVATASSVEEVGVACGSLMQQLGVS